MTTENDLKMEQFGLQSSYLYKKKCRWNGSVDPDQTAPTSSLTWGCTVCQMLSVPIHGISMVFCVIPDLLPKNSAYPASCLSYPIYTMLKILCTIIIYI